MQHHQFLDSVRHKVWNPFQGSNARLHHYAPLAASGLSPVAVDVRRARIVNARAMFQILLSRVGLTRFLFSLRRSQLENSVVAVI